VYITGRSTPDGATDDRLIAIRCDHRDDADVARAFARIVEEAEAVDILVNNVWAGTSA
jgi:NAD(P)-dependent dehydrogenase (short-subunit alcohol dehydrogenase family)